MFPWSVSKADRAVVFYRISKCLPRVCRLESRGEDTHCKASPHPAAPSGPGFAPESRERVRISPCRCSNDVLACFRLEINQLSSSITVNTGTACRGFLFNILLSVVTMSPKNTLEDDIFVQLTGYKFSLRQLCKCVIFPRALHLKQMHKIIKTRMDLFITT